MNSKKFILCFEIAFKIFHFYLILDILLIFVFWPIGSTLRILGDFECLYVECLNRHNF